MAISEIERGIVRDEEGEDEEFLDIELEEEEETKNQEDDVEELIIVDDDGNPIDLDF